MSRKRKADDEERSEEGELAAVDKYIPPHKLRALVQSDDKSSDAYQQIAWRALHKSINSVINKINSGNVATLVVHLFQENLIRARGILVQVLMKAQHNHVKLTNVYVCLAAIINTKLPQIGELLVSRVVIAFQNAFNAGDKRELLIVSSFLAHLINQHVAADVLGLQLLALMLEEPTEDTVEVAVEFTKEVGAFLQERNPKAMNDVFNALRTILQEAKVGQRTQYSIEQLFSIRKDKYAEYPVVISEVDLVEEEDQICHDHIGLGDDDLEGHLELNSFVYDPDYEASEKRYKELKAEILGEEESSSSSEGSSSGSSSSSSSSDDDDAAASNQPTLMQQQVIKDKTETDMVNFRRLIFVTIMSSLSHEECVHKLIQMKVAEELHGEMCNMIIECCSQERTYLRYHGLVAQRLCNVDQRFQMLFEELFAKWYNTIHRLETNKIRNVATLFAHLFHTDAILWETLSIIHLNEKETTSSSRIFIKILFQEISEFMGLVKMHERLRLPELQPALAGLFPRDHPRHARFSINFFTAISLGAITQDLREWLTNAPEIPMPMEEDDEESSSSSSDSSSSSSSSSSEDSDSSSSGSSSDSSGSSSSSSE